MVVGGGEAEEWKAMNRTLLPLIFLCGLAGCSTKVVISDVRAERADSGEVVVRFEADSDLENQGLSVAGYFQLQPDARDRSPDRATCCASLEAIPGRSPARFVYTCRIPAKAEREGDFPEMRPDGKRRSAYVYVPYDLTAPGDHDFEFSVIGGGCGFRGMSSNQVRLTLRMP